MEMYKATGGIAHEVKDGDGDDEDDGEDVDPVLDHCTSAERMGIDLSKLRGRDSGGNPGQKSLPPIKKTSTDLVRIAGELDRLD